MNISCNFKPAKNDKFVSWYDMLSQSGVYVHEGYPNDRFISLENSFGVLMVNKGNIYVANEKVWNTGRFCKVNEKVTITVE